MKYKILKKLFIGKWYMPGQEIDEEIMHRLSRGARHLLEVDHFFEVIDDKIKKVVDKKEAKKEVASKPVQTIVDKPTEATKVVEKELKKTEAKEDVTVKESKSESADEVPVKSKEDQKADSKTKKTDSKSKGSKKKAKKA